MVLKKEHMPGSCLYLESPCLGFCLGLVDNALAPITGWMIQQMYDTHNLIPDSSGIYMLDQLYNTTDIIMIHLLHNNLLFGTVTIHDKTQD